MADNYLEKKMDEYRAANTHKKAMHRPVYGVRPGTISIPFPPLKVFVVNGTSIVGQAVVSAFRKADCKVAFCASDIYSGNKLSQSSGSRFYPSQLMAEDVVLHRYKQAIKDYNSIDVIVICNVGSALLSLLVHEIQNTCNVSVSGYKTRLIIVSEQSDDVALMRNISDGLSVNMVLTDKTHSVAPVIAGLCAFLSAPGNEVIDRQVISL